MNALVSDWVKITVKQPIGQSLIYSNSVAACDGPIITQLNTARGKVPLNNGKFMELTGDCGLMLKTYLMALFYTSVGPDAPKS